MEETGVEDYGQLLKTVFSNKAGDKLLHTWKLNYGDRLSFYAGNSPEETAFREGERSFYQHIVNYLEEVKSGR